MPAIPAAHFARALRPSSFLWRLPHTLRATYTTSFLLPAPAISIWRSMPTPLSLPALTIPTFSNLSSIFETLWNGILLAVPKKKPSKSRSKMRRNSQGKAEKDVKNLVSCSSCGRIKRQHVLCPYCVQSTPSTACVHRSIANRVSDMDDIYLGKTTKPKQDSVD